MSIKNKTEAKKLAEEAAAAEQAKLEAEKAAAEAAKVAAEAAEKQAKLDASILKQEQLLSEIKDILKNK